MRSPSSRPSKQFGIEGHLQTEMLENNDLQEDIDGDGLAFEMQVPNKQSEFHLAMHRYDDINVESTMNEVQLCKPSSDLRMNGIRHTYPFSHQFKQSKSKRELVWLMRLHKEKKGERNNYFQPKMILATKLYDEKLGTENEKPATITCIRSNRSESMLVAGTSQGEVLLFNLRCHPPTLEQKKQFDSATSILNSVPSIRQVEFLDEQYTLLVCNGDLHLFDTRTQTILGSFLPENTRFRNGLEDRTWQSSSSNFVGFSLFPRATGLEEFQHDASYEFAAISQNHVYSIDVRSSDPAFNYQVPILPSNKSANRVKPNDSQIFRAMTWNPTTSPPKEEHPKHQNVANWVKEDNADMLGLSCVTTHADWICTGSSSGLLHCFDRHNGKVLCCWKGHTKSIEYLKTISRHMLLSVSGDKTAVLWDITKIPPQQISRISGESHLPWEHFCVIQS